MKQFRKVMVADVKVFRERTEIAKAINFGKYQVIVIDLADEIIMCDKVVGYRGCKVRVKWEFNGEVYYKHC